jgi:hypothetical protein
LNQKIPLTEQGKKVHQKMIEKMELKNLANYEKNRLTAALGGSVLLPENIADLPFDNSYVDYVTSRQKSISVKGFPKTEKGSFRSKGW